MSALIQCRACGKPISPNATSCPNCGEPLKRYVAKYEMGAAPPPPQKQTATGFLAALLIGLTIGGIIYWFVTGF
jgi:predicted amidophosphoribosyltransferase